MLWHRPRRPVFGDRKLEFLTRWFEIVPYHLWGHCTVCLVHTVLYGTVTNIMFELKKIQKMFMLLSITGCLKKYGSRLNWVERWLEDRLWNNLQHSLVTKYPWPGTSKMWSVFFVLLNLSKISEFRRDWDHFGFI